MANETATAGSGARPAKPSIRKIGLDDLRSALVSGYADFNAMPTHAAFLIVIYPVVMVILARLMAGYDILPLIFPLLTGYTLVGPVIATGIYELSRRREQGLDNQRIRAFDVFRYRSIRAIVILGVLLAVIYFVWLATALTIYKLIFDSAAPSSFLEFAYQVVTLHLGSALPASIEDFARLVFTTESGWMLIVVGSGFGFAFAVVVLTLSVVSFPMLLDRDVGALTAAQTSIRAVLANPFTMTIWGVVVVGLLVIGSIPFFVGLAIVLPLLGHATWHLYRRTVTH